MWNRGVESVESRWDVAPSLPDLTRSVDPRILSFSNFVGAPVGTLVVESRELHEVPMAVRSGVRRLHYCLALVVVSRL